MALAELLTEPSWRTRLAAELASPALATLDAARVGRRVFPPREQTFRALNLTPFERVSVVILGQDPYHGEGQAHGLAFSVGAGVPPPPSLRNIFRELEQDLGVAPRKCGDLTRWAEQGVLLLNTTLTVEEGRAGSHQKQGWERLTDRLVSLLGARPEPLAFLLWGAPAQKKAALVDRARHLVLEAPHPSPLSAHRGFFGCRHFSQTNAFLLRHGRPPIDW